MADTAQTSTARRSRFWEIDVLRTVAIAMMITFHTLYLLNYFDIQNTGVPASPHGFWWWFPRVTGGTFIFVAGISLTITHSKAGRISGFMLRGLKIFAWGMGITLITWLISRAGIRQIRHTPLLRDCVHTRPFLYKIPLHQSAIGHRSDGDRYLPAGTEGSC